MSETQWWERHRQHGEIHGRIGFYECMGCGATWHHPRKVSAMTPPSVSEAIRTALATVPGFGSQGYSAEQEEWLFNELLHSTWAAEPAKFLAAAPRLLRAALAELERLKAENKKLGTCDTCAMWTRVRLHRRMPLTRIFGLCSSSSFHIGYSNPDQSRSESDVYVEGDEDWGFITGPKFGCVHWIEKK